MMIGQRILVIDDDQLLAQAVKRKFENSGFTVELAGTGTEGFRAVSTFSPDLVVLDLALPDVDGTEICRELRRNSSLPIIMLTGRTEETDRIVGLELGADDYIIKPFSINELLARVKAVLRRTTPPVLASPEPPTEQDHVLNASGVTIDTRAHDVTVDGAPVQLTPTEYKLLCVLVESRGRVLSPQELLKKAWDYDQYDPHLIEVHIRNLRQKVEQNPRKPQRIVTVRSFGYKFV